MQHPCIGCRAYSLAHPIGKLYCPKIGQLIALDGCDNIGGAEPIYAQRLIELARQRELDKIERRR